MRYQFNLTLQGEDSIEKKFNESLEKHPTVQMELLRCFTQAIILAFKYDAKDHLCVESFITGKLSGEAEKPQPVEQQTVDK
jgi:hypothetical protein